MLGPAIAAISLGLVGHSALIERLGRNQRFSSVGSLTAAGLMGLIGYAFSFRAIFLLVAALTLPVLVALARIDTADIHFGRSCGVPHHHTPDRPPRAGRMSLWKSPGLCLRRLRLLVGCELAMRTLRFHADQRPAKGFRQRLARIPD